jgi:hypothetical protein
VTSPDGAARWVGASAGCDEGFVKATRSARGADDAVLELQVPRSPGRRCSFTGGHRPGHVVEARELQILPLAWDDSGLAVMLEGQPLVVANDFARAAPLAAWDALPRTPGSPRSPDGKTIVLPFAEGLLVRGAAHPYLFRARDLDGQYTDQHDCTVSDDGAHVACVRGQRAWVGTWDLAADAGP